MAITNERPLSPHLSIWRWGPHMLVSMLHRVTGSGLTILGLAVLTWWLAAAAEGGESYETILGFVTAPFGLLILVGLTWAFYQHLLSGIRHLAMDSGAGFELTTNRRFAILTIVGSVVLTALTWAAFLGVFE